MTSSFLLQHGLKPTGESIASPGLETGEGMNGKGLLVLWKNGLKCPRTGWAYLLGVGTLGASGGGGTGDTCGPHLEPGRPGGTLVM